MTAQLSLSELLQSAPPEFRDWLFNRYGGGLRRGKAGTPTGAAYGVLTHPGQLPGSPAFVPSGRGDRLTDDATGRVQRAFATVEGGPTGGMTQDQALSYAKSIRRQDDRAPLAVPTPSARPDTTKTASVKTAPKRAADKGDPYLAWQRGMGSSDDAHMAATSAAPALPETAPIPGAPPPGTYTIAGGAGNDTLIGGTAPAAAAASSRPMGQPGPGPSGPVFDQFMGTVRTGGLTNPFGLAAVASTGRAESGWSPANAARTWSDPSESGQPGQAGGIMSWRAERYRALQNFANRVGGNLADPNIQAQFFLQENPALIGALQNARSVEEAQGLMNNAWKFAGYNRSGGEAARRLGFAQNYLSQFQGGGAPTAIAGGSGTDVLMGGGGGAIGSDTLPALPQGFSLETDLPTDRPGYQVVQPNQPVPLEMPPLPQGFEIEQGGQHPEFDGSNIPGYNPQTGMVEKTDEVDKATAFLSGALEGVPVIGPALGAGARAGAAALVAPFSDKSFGEVYDDMGGIEDRVQSDNPYWTLGGNVTGAVAPMIPLGMTALGGKLLGMTGPLGQRMALGAGTNALIGAADTAARGGDDQDVARNTLIGGAIGGAIPLVGRGLNMLGGAVRDAVAPRLNALWNPIQEAGRRVGKAITTDRANSLARPLDAADEASAALNNQQLMNVDRGGETTRALARSAANQDPEAREIIARTASDRFAEQGARAQSFINRIMGGNVDDLAVQDALNASAKAANKPAYDKAYKAVAAQDMWDQEFAQMMQAPAMREAAKGATGRGANRAVVEGFEPVKNPFTEVNGKISLRIGEDGSIARPTLQFWDQVKRNLDDKIGEAKRAGSKTLAGDLKALKDKLVTKLDSAVPEYSTARRGAAAFFDAEDALDAGRKFVTTSKAIPEARRALAKMNPAEREVFAVGFASELKDAIKEAPDRMNVINKIFGSEAARDKVALALGPQRYQEFEQFVKVEHAMDMLRGAMGNSTTARQLVELGLAGSAGTAAGLYTGDWKTGVTAALLTRGARAYGNRVDTKIAKRVAELLISDDPKQIELAVKMAARNPRAAAAMEGIRHFLAAGIKGGGNVATRPRQPLEITVTEPAAVSP